MATPNLRIPTAFEAETYDFAEPTGARHFCRISSTPCACGTLLAQPVSLIDRPEIERQTASIDAERQAHFQAQAGDA